jgi:hypothetical protein
MSPTCTISARKGDMRASDDAPVRGEKERAREKRGESFTALESTAADSEDLGFGLRD